MRFKTQGSIQSVSRLAKRSVFVLCIIVPFGCSDDDDDSGGGTSDGMGVCPVCASSEDIFLCDVNHQEVYRCYVNFAAAELGCEESLGDHVVGNGPATCDNQTADTDSGWSPGSYVSYNSGTGKYEVDGDFFDKLLTYPDQLLYDGARIEWHGGHFEFKDIGSGDLASELGFQNGDELASVNDYDVSTIAEAFTAYDAVYGSSSFSVEVVRSGTPVTLEYVIQ